MVFDHDYKEFPELTNTQIAEFGFTSPHPQYIEDFEATVFKVYDGDTYRLETKDRDFDFPLRLLDIDCKEMNDGGDEARDYVRGLILKENVTIKIDKKNRVGKYGRLLGRVLYGGIDVGQTLLRLGFAVKFENRNQSKVIDINKLFRPGKWF